MNRYQDLLIFFKQVPDHRIERHKLHAVCEIQISYAIGIAEPTSINVNTFGTAKLPHAELIQLLREYFDLRSYGIIKMLDLLQPMYRQAAAYGHFGREDLDLSWENLDRVKLLLKAA